MPRRRNAKGGRGLDQVTISGRKFLALSVTSNLATLVLTPGTIGGRCEALSDAFMLFRFVDLKVHFSCGSAPATAVPQENVVGYSSVIVTAAPTTATQVYEMDRAAVCHGLNLEPATLRVPRSVLLHSGPVWYRRGTTYDDTDEQQGVLYGYVTGNAATLNVWIEWTIELADPVATGVSLKRERCSGPGVTPASSASLSDDLRVLVLDEEEKSEPSSGPARRVVRVLSRRD